MRSTARRFGSSPYTPGRTTAVTARLVVAAISITGGCSGCPSTSNNDVTAPFFSSAFHFRCSSSPTVGCDNVFPLRDNDGSAPPSEAAVLVRATGARLRGVLIALDRQERMENGTSAVLGVAEVLGAPVHSIVTLQDVITYLDLMPGYADALVQIRSYQQQYCVKS